MSETGKSFGQMADNLSQKLATLRQQRGMAPGESFQPAEEAAAEAGTQAAEQVLADQIKVLDEPSEAPSVEVDQEVSNQINVLPEENDDLPAGHELHEEAVAENLARDAARTAESSAESGADQLTDQDRELLESLNLQVVERQDRALAEVRETGAAVEEAVNNYDAAQENLAVVTDPEYPLQLLQEEADESDDPAVATQRRGLFGKLKQWRDRGRRGGGRFADAESSATAAQYGEAGKHLDKSWQNAKKVGTHAGRFALGVGAILYGASQVVYRPFAAGGRAVRAVGAVADAGLRGVSGLTWDAANVAGGAIREGAARGAAGIIRNTLNSEVPEIRAAVRDVQRSDNAEVVSTATLQMQEQMMQMAEQMRMMQDMMAQMQRQQQERG